MKLLMSILIYVLPWMLMAQTVEQLDFVAPAEGDYAAVQKGTQWGFIDASGELAVPFRNDLVAYANEATDTDLGVAGQMYPVLLEDRSIVYRIKDGIAYYGFIDATGNVIIEPQYLNVTNFKNGLALALELEALKNGENGVAQISGELTIKDATNPVTIESKITIEDDTITFLGKFSVTVADYNIKIPAIVRRNIAKEIEVSFNFVHYPYDQK